MKKLNGLNKFCFFSTLFFLNLSCMRPQVEMLPSLKLRSIVIDCVNTNFPKSIYVACNLLGTYSDKSTTIISDGSVKWATDSAELSAGTSNSQSWIKGSSSGTYQISATYLGLVANKAVTVTSATPQSLLITPFQKVQKLGTSLKYTALCLYSDGTYYDVTNSVQWLSSQDSVAYLETEASRIGTISARSQGSAVISITLESLSSSTTLFVLEKDLLSVQITPTTADVVQNLHQNYYLTGLYSDYSTVDLTSYATWSISDISKATVSDSAGTKGKVIGVSPGTSQVIALFAGLSATAMAVVSNPTLNSISISPSAYSMAKGLSTTLVATGHFSNGVSVNISDYATWSSSAPAVAAVNNSTGSKGQTTGVAVGAATVTATYSAVNATANMTILAPALVSIAVSPATATVTAITPVQYTALGTYTDGTVVDITNSCSWTSTNILTATITPTGLAVGAGLGNTTIISTSGSVSGTAQLNGM